MYEMYKTSSPKTNDIIFRSGKEDRRRYRKNERQQKVKKKYGF